MRMVLVMLALVACGGSDGSDDPFDAPEQCTSNKHWTFGERKDERMHPGVACIDCHAMRQDAPPLSSAGTVYPTAHEPDDCNGSAGNGGTVVLTDATNKTFEMQIDEVGNFYTNLTITYPVHAKVVANGKTREMDAAITDGDCNKCHTQNGTQDAPGRVVMP